MEREQDCINLQDYTQKELLKMTYTKVNELAADVKDMKATQAKHEVRISVIESRVMMWGGLFGAAGAGLMQLIISYFK